MLFPYYLTDFEKFLNSFLDNKKAFLAENEELLENYGNFELDKLKTIEVIYIFGDNKRKVWMTDWKGEENEREIENFIENRLQIKTDWTNVNELRRLAGKEKQRDSEFIIDLLKTIDKDLEPINKRLVFFDLGWDAYVYTVVDETSQRTITEKFRALFHGTEKLKK